MRSIDSDHLPVLPFALNEMYLEMSWQSLAVRQMRAPFVVAMGGAASVKESIKSLYPVRHFGVQNVAKETAFI